MTPNSVARLYGAANPLLAATLSGVQNGDAITVSFSTLANATSPAGPYSIIAALSGAKLDDYTVTANTGTLTVTPAPLVVTVANASKIYGAANPAFGVGYQGFVLGQTPSALGGSPAFSTTANAASGVGVYTVSASGLTSSNYALSFVNGVLSVTPAPLLVTPANQSRVYGAANPILTGTIIGLENNDPITAAYSTSASPTNDTGTYPINATLNDPSSKLTNYTVTISPSTLTIAPAPLMVTPNSVARLYGAANPLLAGTLSGVQNGDAITASFSTPANAASSAGPYSITAALSGAKLDDYSVTANAGTLTVTPALLVVTVADASRIYGALNPALTGTITGLANNDSITATYTTSANATSDAGTDPISATLNDPASKLGNYTVTINPGILTIAPAPLLVAPNSVVRLYGAANPLLTGTLSGIENGDSITASFSTLANATSPVGPFSITAVLSGAKLDDYTVTANTGTLTVAPAPLVVTVADALKIYGAANPALTGSITGLENEDPITATYTTSANAASDAGTDPIGATLYDPANKLGNYTVTISPGTLTIAPAPLLVIPNSVARLYGAANPLLTGPISGIENGDAITASFSTPANTSSPAGSYSITASLSGAKLDDYTVTANTGTLTVTPAPLVVTVADASKIYGAANPAFAVTYQGFVSGQDASILGGTLTYSTPATASSSVGSYTISASGLTLSNYAISYGDGTLMVTPAPLLVKPENQSRLYGAANPGLTGAITGLHDDDSITATYTTSADATSDVGDYDITANLEGTALGNYSVTINTGALTVTPAPLLVTPDSLVKTYGAANPPLTGTLSGVQNGDAITAGYNTTAGTASAVGVYDITAAPAGAKLQDYAITAATGTLTIEPAPLVVTVTDTSRVYGAVNPAFGVKFQGFVLGQDATVLDGTPTFATTAVRSSPVGAYPVTASGLTAVDYALSFAAATLNITPAPLTVAPANGSRVYGAANPAFTGTITGLQNDDPITAAYTTSAGSNSDTGTYPIVATLSDPTNALGNYAVTVNTGTLTVTPAPLVVTPDNLVKTYGDNAVLTGQVAGQQPGDTFNVTYASAGSAAAAGAGGYPITVAAVSGARLADYDVTTTTATLTVNPAPLTVSPAPPTVTGGGIQITSVPTPLVTVLTAQFQSHKLSRKKSVKELVVDYSGALEPGPAQVPGSYQLLAAQKGKKLGTRNAKAVAIASATYNPTAQSVTLTLAGKLPSGPLQLTISASNVLDAAGLALDGNHDGQPGGNFQTTLGG